MAKDVKIRITAEDKTRKAIFGVKANLASLGRAGRAIGRGFSTLTSSLVRGFRNVMFATTALAAAGVALVKTFTVQQDAEAALAAALGHTGQKLTDTMAKYKKFAAEIQKTTKFGDEAILAQMAYAKNLGVTEDQLEATTTAAIGLAAKLGIDLKTSMMLMGRAALGQTQMLTRYGIVLDETLTPQEKFNALLKIGANSFVLAEKAAQTTSGAFTQFKNKVGDVAEQLGRGISETLGLEGVLNSLTDSLDSMLAKWKADGTIDEWAERARPVLEEIASLVSDIFAGGEAQASAFEKIKGLGASLGATAIDIMVAGAERFGAKIVIGMLKAPMFIGRGIGSIGADITSAGGKQAQEAGLAKSAMVGTSARVIAASATLGGSEAIGLLARVISEKMSQNTKAIEDLRKE